MRSPGFTRPGGRFDRPAYLRVRACAPGAAQRPTYRWLTANELADQAEAAEIAADNASMAR